MNLKIRMLGASVIVLAAGGALFVLLSAQSTYTFYVAAATAPAVTASATAAEGVVPASVGVPKRIRIPSIALDAAIEHVGLKADGSMDVPKQPFDTAWYELGPRPGETGSAAIAGHVDWIGNAAAVFADLHTMKSGDTIMVEDDQGAVTSFVVRESRSYDAAADATAVFSSTDGKAHLNLITCAGAWDARAKQYAERLVVFADKE